MSAEYKYPAPDNSWRGRTRDRIARGIATWALEKIATPWYRAMIGGSIRLGLQAAQDEAREERSISFEELMGEPPEEVRS